MPLLPSLESSSASPQFSLGHSSPFQPDSLLSLLLFVLMLLLFFAFPFPVLLSFSLFPIYVSLFLLSLFVFSSPSPLINPGTPC